MLAQQLGHNLVLFPDLGLKGLDLADLGRLLPGRLAARLIENRRPLLEQLLLPSSL